ncbi:hypothetical protein ACG6R3_002797 [Enterococcus faecium]
MSVLSEKFQYFVSNNEMSGIADQIAETNAIVADGDIQVREFLDSGVGRKYFYECMKLAENVIISFEQEESE